MHLASSEVGFEVIDGWPSCYYHPELKVFLIVYVDDFMMAGPTDNMAEAWRRIGYNRKGGIDIEEPREANDFLGCKHERERITLPNGRLAG